jgi:hypothetical protein
VPGLIINNGVNAPTFFAHVPLMVQPAYVLLSRKAHNPQVIYVCIRGLHRGMQNGGTRAYVLCVCMEALKGLKNLFIIEQHANKFQFARRASSSFDIMECNGAELLPKSSWKIGRS